MLPHRKIARQRPKKGLLLTIPGIESLLLKSRGRVQSSDDRKCDRPGFAHLDPTLYSYSWLRAGAPKGGTKSSSKSSCDVVGIPGGWVKDLYAFILDFNWLYKPTQKSFNKSRIERGLHTVGAWKACKSVKQTGNGIDIKSMKHLLVGCRSLNEMNNVI